MRKVPIFYHLYQTCKQEKVFSELLARLERSGLYSQANHIYIGVTGDQPIPVSPTPRIKVVRNTDTSSEVPTVRALYEFCMENSEFNILNLHPTGITWTEQHMQNNIVPIARRPYPVWEINENKTLWRKYLEFFTIDKWRECERLLDFFDCVGTEWTTHAVLAHKQYYLPHYAGNIWWARSEYIKTLNWNFIESQPDLRRWFCECWIGSGNPKYYNFYFSGRNLYLSPIHESHYNTVEVP